MTTKFAWLLAMALCPAAANLAATKNSTDVMAPCPTPVKMRPLSYLYPPHTEFFPDGSATYALKVGRVGKVLSASLREWHVTPDESWFRAAIEAEALKVVFSPSKKEFTCEMRYRVTVK